MYILFVLFNFSRGFLLDFRLKCELAGSFTLNFWRHLILFSTLLHFYPLILYSWAISEIISLHFGAILKNQTNISNIYLLYWSNASPFSLFLHLPSFFYINSTINAVNWIYYIYFFPQLQSFQYFTSIPLQCFNTSPIYHFILLFTLILFKVIFNNTFYHIRTQWMFLGFKCHYQIHCRNYSIRSISL